MLLCCWCNRKKALLLHLAGEGVQDLYPDLVDPDLSLLTDQRTQGDDAYNKCIRILSHYLGDTTDVHSK